MVSRCFDQLGWFDQLGGVTSSCSMSCVVVVAVQQHLDEMKLAW
jgi:hypothetical protein